MSEFGPPEVLVERTVEDPTPGAGEVLIAVELVNLTFVETQIRAGRAPRSSMLPQLPAIPGNGVGGVVAAVGPDGDPGLLGSRVVSSTGGSGAYAELVTVPSVAPLVIPEHMSMRDGVALLADGRTAIGLSDRARLTARETVLVEAAAGGVGSLLVQLASAAGARVIAAAGAEPKLQLARDLGAEITIDYTRDAWTQDVARVTGTRGVDVVFDGVGGAIGRAAFELLGPGGRYCPFGMASGSFAPIADNDACARSVTIVRPAPLDEAETLRLTSRALQSAAVKTLRPVIGQTFPLAHAADAHRAIEARATLGKTLLVTDAGAEDTHRGPHGTGG
jgi:NADPH2:quinone reductase